MPGSVKRLLCMHLHEYIKKTDETAFIVQFHRSFRISVRQQYDISFLSGLRGPGSLVRRPDLLLFRSL